MYDWEIASDYVFWKPKKEESGINPLILMWFIHVDKVFNTGHMHVLR